MSWFLSFWWEEMAIFSAIHLYVYKEDVQLLYILLLFDFYWSIYVVQFNAKKKKSSKPTHITDNT